VSKKPKTKFRPVGQCKLCLQTKELCLSHYLPHALYKKSRYGGKGNPNPMLITAKAAVQTSDEIRDYVLCQECEDLFNKNGESYAMSQVNEKGRFPLMLSLMDMKPTKVAHGFAGYSQQAAPGIDRDKLAYFAISVFWRGSVYAWEKPEKPDPPLSLGPYGERFRTYLLGETGFPANTMLLLVVCTDNHSQNTFYTPSRGLKDQNTSYTFQTRGLNYFLMVGKQIPDDLRGNCLVTGEERRIMMRSCEEKVVEATARLLKGRKPEWK